MENYWDVFCRKNNSYFGTLAMSVILESFYWYCNDDIEQSDNILKEAQERLIPKSDLPDLLPCPNCESRDLRDAYVYIACKHCLMEGPKMNNGHNDAHSDHMDHKWAIKYWNNLPRKNKI